MSKRIRPTIEQPRPAHTRGRKRPIWVIATGGEVFILRRAKGAFTWIPATEADFGMKPDAANDAGFDDPQQQ